MAKLMRKMLLLAKIESPAGTDSVPTTTNAMLVSGMTPELITANYVDRDNIKPYSGNNAKIATGIHREVTFSVEIAGAGTAGGTPAWDCLLRACAFAASTPGGSPGEKHYTPIDPNSSETITIYEYLDGIRWIMTGCIGTVSLNFTSGGIPKFTFKFIGEYQAGSDTALPSNVSYSSFVAPVAVGKVWTPTFNIHSVAACMDSLNIDMANNAIYRDLVGCGGPAITDRKPAGTAVFELPTIATKAWDEVIKNSTSGALNFVHGRTAGNIVQVECPYVTCDSASIQDKDGVAMLSLGLSIQPNTGNDELVITCS